MPPHTPAILQSTAERIKRFDARGSPTGDACCLAPQKVAEIRIIRDLSLAMSASHDENLLRDVRPPAPISRYDSTLQKVSPPC